MPAKQEQSIVKQHRKLGKPLPALIRNKPILIDDELYLWRAFSELDTERPSGRDVMLHIPIIKIFEYAIYTGIEASYMNRFLYCIRQMDMHHVGVNNDKLLAIMAERKVGK